MLQWSHAQLSVETRLLTGGLNFDVYASMEPRSAERGNLACPCSPTPDFLALQWSHAQLSVETREAGAHHRRRAAASMEPRSAERGNLNASLYFHFWLKLQWSHAQLSVETPCNSGG